MLKHASGGALLGGFRNRARLMFVVIVAIALSLVHFDVGGLAFASPEAAGRSLPSTPKKTEAGLGGFQPGLIISDALFYDSNAMSAGEIQSFLDSKIGTCQNGNCLNVATIVYPGRARDVSTSTGNLICDAIPAGTMRVSELIYLAQSACGISAKVILVTLQKEQGLILKKAPSDSALRWAMGMACPDTAPCDTASAGLGTQIVTGTRQLKVYKAAGFARQPGTQFIYWNPNAACGGTYVNVQNYATAALYNYTPYQPNAAALANPYGAGDGCSSYGNRNFWAFFTDWFGSTTGGGSVAINEAYEQAGGLSTLGAGVAYLDCATTANRCWPKYENGSIYWSIGTGADVVFGAKDTAYRAFGGPDGTLGYPRTGEYQYTENGGGSAQVFEKGSLFQSEAGIFPVYGPIRSAYFAKQGAWGELGWPTSGAECELTSCSQIFQHGAVVILGTDVYYLDQSERDAWVVAGGATGALGVPVSALLSYSENGGGTARVYTGGSVFSSSAGTFAITNPVRSAYFSQKGAWGELGWPASAQSCTETGCWQRFEHGVIVTNGTAPFTFANANFDAYLSAGGPTGVLGFPTSVQYTYIQNGGGTARVFERGSLFSSPAGSFAVTEPIRAAYFAQQGAWGALGWPTSAMACTDGTCSQQFQGGVLSKSGSLPPEGEPPGATTAMYMGRITTLANQSRLGTPTTGMLVYTENGGGVARGFGQVTVFSSDSGAFLVAGAVRAAYFVERGAWGDLGWPVAAQQCISSGCWQRFQGGVVYAGGAGTAVLSTAEYDTYDTLGGPIGALGMPVSEIYSYAQNGGGTARIFARGTLFTSSAGAFAVTDPIRAAYFAKQGAWGDLGWPTSSVVMRDGVVLQIFQHGAIGIVGGEAQYLGDAERDVWVASGGATGSLGMPKSETYTYIQNGGGTARIYAHGSIFASSAGVFAVADPLRQAYFTKQGAWGELGWPTSIEVVESGAKLQEFQHGAIVINGGTTHFLNSAERDLWIASGGATGSLGLPVSMVTYTENGGGTARIYARGTVFTSASGMFAVTEPVRATYFASQGAWGSYGWPSSTMTCDSGTCTQHFQNGTITVPSG